MRRRVSVSRGESDPNRISSSAARSRRTPRHPPYRRTPSRSTCSVVRAGAPPRGTSPVIRWSPAMMRSSTASIPPSSANVVAGLVSRRPPRSTTSIRSGASVCPMTPRARAGCAPSRTDTWRVRDPATGGGNGTPRIAAAVEWLKNWVGGIRFAYALASATWSGGSGCGTRYTPRNGRSSMEAASRRAPTPAAFASGHVNASAAISCAGISRCLRTGPACPLA
jgi:hypothetical protein